MGARRYLNTVIRRSHASLKGVIEVVERKGEFKIEKEKTYSVPIKCGECGHNFNVRVPKGTTFEDYRKRGILCPNCECRALD